MSANHALLGPSASNLRLTRSSAESFLDARFSPEGRLAHARHPAPPALAHDPRHALARGAHARPPQLEEHLRCAVYVAYLRSDLGYHRRKLLVAHRVRARRAPLPRAVALAGHLERGAHLRHRPGALVEGDELELRPLRRLAYSCLLAKKALAFKSISFSRHAPAQVLGHLERVVSRPEISRVGLLDPVREAARVVPEPARHLGVGGAGLSVKHHGLPLELGRVLGRWGSHACLQSSVARVMRNGNRLVNGNGADSDSDSIIHCVQGHGHLLHPSRAGSPK